MDVVLIVFCYLPCIIQPSHPPSHPHIFPIRPFQTPLLFRLDLALVISPCIVEPFGCKCSVTRSKECTVRVRRPAVKILCDSYTEEVKDAYVSACHIWFEISALQTFV